MLFLIPCIFTWGRSHLPAVLKRDGKEEGFPRLLLYLLGFFQSYCSAAGEQPSFVWRHECRCLVALLDKVESERIQAVQVPGSGFASSRPVPILDIPCRGGCSEVAEDILISTIFFTVNLLFSGCGLHEHSAEGLTVSDQTRLIAVSKTILLPRPTQSLEAFILL